MERRRFLQGAVAGLLAARRDAEAQPVRKVYRIGILALGLQTSSMIGPQPRNAYTKALLDGLRELGYVYGDHFVTEPRGAEGKPDRYPGLVAELLRLQVDIIVAVPASLPALKRATSTIPIVMTGAGDPVGGGFAQSLAHPGGNFTGLSNQDRELIGKRLEILKQLVPTTAPVGIVWDRTGSGGSGSGSAVVWQVAEAAARERGWKLLSLEIRDANEIERAFKAATDARVGAILAASAFLFGPQGMRVTEIAAKSGLPTMYSFRFYVENGGLMSYAADLLHIWRRERR